MKNFNSFIHAGYYRLLLLLMVFFYINQTNGQRLIGGEFTYTNSGEIITFYVTTYSLYLPNSNAILEFGDGGSSVLDFTSEMINDSVYKNTATALHVFFSNGLYKVTCDADLLIDSVRNIENSGTRSLFMEVTFYSEVVFTNTTPIYTNSIIDFTVSDLCAVSHQESAYDADGDSLVYIHNLFTVDNGTEIYSSFPETTDTIGINTETGDFNWHNAVYRALYGIQFVTSEYRDGELVGSSMRKIITPVNCGIVSTHDFFPEAISVFPNPAINEISFGGKLNGITQYSILDATGKVVLQDVISGNSISGLNNLQSGIYLLVIEQNDQKRFAKFVKA